MAVVGIAADSVKDTADTQKDYPQITCLTDLGGTVSQQWGLMIPQADHPEPGTYIVEKDGTVKYRRLEEKGKGDWPTYAELAAAL